MRGYHVFGGYRRNRVTIYWTDSQRFLFQQPARIWICCLRVSSSAMRRRTARPRHTKLDSCQTRTPRTRHMIWPGGLEAKTPKSPAHLERTSDQPSTSGTASISWQYCYSGIVRLSARPWKNWSRSSRNEIDAGDNSAQFNQRGRQGPLLYTSELLWPLRVLYLNPVVRTYPASLRRRIISELEIPGV